MYGCGLGLFKIQLELKLTVLDIYYGPSFWRWTKNVESRRKTLFLVCFFTFHFQRQSTFSFVHSSHYSSKFWTHFDVHRKKTILIVYFSVCILLCMSRSHQFDDNHYFIGCNKRLVSERLLLCIKHLQK